MSRTNKVNPDHYTLAGRLSPDDLARERARQFDTRSRGLRRRPVEKPMPPWMATKPSMAAPTQVREDAAPARAAKRASKKTARKAADRPASSARAARTRAKTVTVRPAAKRAPKTAKQITAKRVTAGARANRPSTQARSTRKR
jgi:hypothetical protein